MDRAPTWPLAADESLLRRFLAGQPAACRTVERWAREILVYRRLGLTREDREDVVQDVLAGVWRAAGRPGFALRHGLRALVRTITLARAIDRVRRRRPAGHLGEDLADPSPGPEALADRDRDRADLHAALETLDAPCREIIRLHFFESWPYARIAARTGRAEATMRVRMFHCLRALRAFVSSGTQGPGS